MNVSPVKELAAMRPRAARSCHGSLRLSPPRLRPTSNAMTEAAGADGLEGVVAAAKQAPGRGLPPVHLWNPVHCGEIRSEEHTSELQSLRHLVCRLLLEKKKKHIMKKLYKKKKKKNTTEKKKWIIN